jgi:hypothetical protein
MAGMIPCKKRILASKRASVASGHNCQQTRSVFRGGSTVGRPVRRNQTPAEWASLAYSCVFRPATDAFKRGVGYTWTSSSGHTKISRESYLAKENSCIL